MKKKLLIISLLLLLVIVIYLYQKQELIPQDINVPEEKTPVTEEKTPLPEEKTLSELQTTACNAADKAGTCTSRLIEVGIVTPQECCDILEKCC